MITTLVCVRRDAQNLDLSVITIFLESKREGAKEKMSNHVNSAAKWGSACFKWHTTFSKSTCRSDSRAGRIVRRRMTTAYDFIVPAKNSFHELLTYSRWLYYPQQTPGFTASNNNYQAGMKQQQAALAFCKNLVLLIEFNKIFRICFCWTESDQARINIKGWTGFKTRFFK